MKHAKTPAEAMAGNFTRLGLQGIAASWRAKIEEIDALNELHGDGKGREYRDAARAEYAEHHAKTIDALAIREQADHMAETQQPLGAKEER